MKRGLIFHSIGHFFVDFLCAWLILGRCAGTAHWMYLALFYNFYAFAMQLPLGILADRLGRCRPFALLGAFIAVLALLPLGTWFTAWMAGLGNAAYHVGGGRAVLTERRGYGPLGIFVAPGAVGLMLGSCLRTVPWVGPAAGAGLILAALLAGVWEKRLATALRWDRRLPLLFLVVILRSFVGMTLAAPWKVGLAAAAAAILTAMGKALGGLAADRLGARWAGGVSLLLAGPLFLFPQSATLGLCALTLFNMSMPITLKEAADAMGPGGAFGLLTLALFLGFLPVLFGIRLGADTGAVLAAASGVLLILGTREEVPCIT